MGKNRVGWEESRDITHKVLSMWSCGAGARRAAGQHDGSQAEFGDCSV